MSDTPGYFKAGKLKAMGQLQRVHVPGSEREVLVAVHEGSIFAMDNRCCHSRGKLSSGDIEDITMACEGGAHADGCSIPGPCVLCPKHRRKFNDGMKGGGLYFSLADGRGFTKFGTKGSKYAQDIYDVQTNDAGEVLISYEPKIRAAADRKKDKKEKKKDKKKKSKKKKTHKKRRRTSSDDDSDHELRKSHDFVWRLARKTLCVDNGSGMNRLVIFDFEQHSCKVNLERSIQEGQAWHIEAALLTTDGSIAWDYKRDYTPISTLADYEAGRIRLLVKVYPDGALTSKLDAMAEYPGAATSATGVEWAAGCYLHISPPQHTMTVPPDADWLMLAVGGTGFAPALQLARHWHQHSQGDSSTASTAKGSPTSVVHMLCSSRTAAEAQLYEKLCEGVKAAGAAGIRCTYTVTGDGRLDGVADAGMPVQPVQRGRISVGMLQRVLPGTGRGHVVISGPPGFNEHVARCLSELGFVGESVTILDA